MHSHITHRNLRGKNKTMNILASACAKIMLFASQQSDDPFIRIHDAGQAALEGRGDIPDADAAGGHKSFFVG
jgi:hypothetical protein